MTGLDCLLVTLTVFLHLTSCQNLSLQLDQPGEEETSPTVTETALETTETSVERLDDCEEDEWSCHQKGKSLYMPDLVVGCFAIKTLQYLW